MNRKHLVACFAGAASICLAACAASKKAQTTPESDKGGAPAIIQRTTPPRYHPVPQGTYAEAGEEKTPAPAKAEKDSARATGAPSPVLEPPQPQVAPVGDIQGGPAGSTEHDSDDGAPDE